ncbi:MAG TPA: polysaccharide biosynthesis/export family protein [Alloacidobacterium sp.]|jgi:polysaccharide export outer membrane protein|nr:polysaccharide biosynthesis/export family protein [Alloacidobacterium sp.]
MKKNRSRHHFILSGIGLFAISLSGIQPGFAQQPAAEPQDQQPTSAPNIAIGAGDLLNIVVFDTPELTTSARVSQDGDVNLPVLGTMKLAGLNTLAAARKIEDELRSRHLILDPHVTVFIVEYASQGATVIGEVRTPGIYPTLGTRKLLDMLSVAGGLQTTAGKSVSIVHRNDPQHPVTIALQSGPGTMYAQENPVILPGDTIVVSKAGVVYVIGDVLKPGGFLIDNNTPISVMQSLSLAGGWDKTAALSKTKLIRKTQEGREEVDLDLKHVAYGSQADLSVRDGDIIFVPSSINKTLTYRGIEAAITITSGLLIYLH